MSAHPPLRVVIDEAGFRRLVTGNPLLARSTAGLRVEISLSDLDWTRMMRAILDGMAPQCPPDPPQAREFLPLRRRR